MPSQQITQKQITQGVKMSSETRDRLKALGQNKDRSTHWMMSKAVEQYLEREECYEREKREDMQRWESYVLSGEHISGSDMETWLNDKIAQAEEAKQAVKA